MMNNEEIIKPEKIITKNEFKIAGIGVRVNNSPEGLNKISQLWAQFMQEDIMKKIEGKVNPKIIFEAYTEYEKDFTGEYTIILGSEIDPGMQIANGLIIKTIPSSKYAVFHVTNSNKIRSTWEEIWKLNINRSYSGDFEMIYPDNTAEIYVAVK